MIMWNAFLCNDTHELAYEHLNYGSFLAHPVYSAVSFFKVDYYLRSSVTHQ